MLGAVVMPVSPASAQIVLSIIKVGEDPSAMAFNPAGTFAYVDSDGSNSVSKINLATDTVEATINVGYQAMGIAVNPAGTFAFFIGGDSMDGYASRLSKINLATNTVIATIIGGENEPWAIAVNPAGTFAYVTYRDSDSVSKINLATSVSNTTVTMPASAKVLAAYANLTVANGSTILLRVASSSIKVCKVSGASLNVINSGSCKVRVTVKPKVGKSVSKMVTLDVTK